jgi:hypothetical protein
MDRVSRHGSCPSLAYPCIHHLTIVRLTVQKDLNKQYKFVLRLFHNARRRLDNTNDPEEQKHVLLAPGRQALDYHAARMILSGKKKPPTSGGEVYSVMNSVIPG